MTDQTHRDDWGFPVDEPMDGEDWTTDPKTGIRVRVAVSRVEESGAATMALLDACGAPRRRDSGNWRDDWVSIKAAVTAAAA